VTSLKYLMLAISLSLFIRKPALGTGWRMNSGAARYLAVPANAAPGRALPCMPPPLNPKARAVMVPGLLPVVINTITRHRSILGVQLDRALCCQVLRLAGLSLFSHLHERFSASFCSGHPRFPRSHRLSAGAERFAHRLLKSGSSVLLRASFSA
ncbi:hypothetical protein, partial [Achromobacter marplatensis]